VPVWFDFGKDAFPTNYLLQVLGLAASAAMLIALLVAITSTFDTR